MIELNAKVVHGFTSSLLMRGFDNVVETPEFHHEIWDLVCSEYPNVAIAAPRRHAKSTAITHCYVLAAALFRQRDYIFIVSDTESQAKDFLNDIKKELVENEDLIDLFGVDRLLKDNEADIIVKLKDGHQFRIKAYGSEQKVRGRKWRGKRPNLVVCDDLENDEIVMNEERRYKFRMWFLNALMEVGSKDCLFRVAGTILHQDSLLARITPSHVSDTASFDGLRLTDPAKDKKTGWKSVLYQAHNEDMSEILWPENYDREFFEQKRSEKVAQGHPEGYSQEYLNRPIDDSVAYFRKEDLKPLTELDEYGDYYVGADLAISSKDNRAYTAIVVAKLLRDRRIQVVDVRRFRGDGREILDEIFSVQKRYDPVMFAIEKENISSALGGILYEEMGSPGRPFINLRIMTTGGKDKERRARSIQARTRAGKVEFDHNASWWPSFQEEMLYFPRGSYMDQVDAFAYIGLMLDKMVETKSEQELLDEAYEEEYEDSYGLEDLGINATTGY